MPILEGHLAGSVDSARIKRGTRFFVLFAGLPDIRLPLVFPPKYITTKDGPCEDAARKLQHMLDQKEEYRDFWLRVNHYESLHAHDAVSITTKGIANGFRP